jgi:2-polyprenyl-6-methoxyphenol hydroxylase-like FAD-dependent oxidoreductase
VTRRYRIGIVGFGMAGGLSAYLLARDGHAVTLLERAPELGFVGAGVLLQASGQAVLRHLGALDQVLAHSAPLDELYARQADGGREMITNRYGDLDPGCRAYGVHRAVLFDAVHDLVKTQPVDLRLGCDAVARSAEPGGVFLTDSRGGRHGPFDFVIAGDGSRSRFRAACGFVAHVWPYSHGTLWAVAPGPAVPGKLLQVVRGTRKLFGLLPLGDGLSTLYWGLPVRDYEATRKRGLAALKDEILAFAPEAAGVLDSIREFDQLLMTTYRHVWMPRWHDRHTLFLGDAAHAMSPHLGQGINLAMVDAWRLAQCLREASSPQAAFRAFHQAQRAYIRYYAAVTYLLSPFFQSDWRVLGWARDVALPLLPMVPGVKRQMLLTVSGMKGGFFGGRIEV